MNKYTITSGMQIVASKLNRNGRNFVFYYCSLDKLTIHHLRKKKLELKVFVKLHTF